MCVLVRSLVLLMWCTKLVFYVGDLMSTRFFFVAFLCVGTRFLYELLFASCAYVVHGVTGIATNNRVAGGWKIVSTGGLGFALPVLLSLQSIFGVGVGGGAGVGTAFVRYISYSYLEKSNWSSSAGVALLLGDSESPAVLGAPDLLRLGDGIGRSMIQAYIDFFGVPLAAKDGFKKLDVASSKASSSSWSSASSRKFGVPFFQGESGGRRLRSPAARITGDMLHGLVCNCFSFRVVLVTSECKLLY